MPFPDPQTPDDLSAVRALASLNETAELWAEQTNLTSTVAAVANADDRESRIEALMKLAFVEGAYRLFCQAKDDGVLDVSRTSDEALIAIRRITGNTHPDHRHVNRPYTALSQIDQIARKALA
jgi:hypothetical protein